MLELVVTLCLMGGDACRDVLLPGYEASEVAGCERALSAVPPDLVPFAAYDQRSEPHCVPVGEALAFEEAAPGVFVHRGLIEEPTPDNGGDVANIAFVIGDRSVAVIDSGAAHWVGEGIWRAIRARTDLPVSHVILTHMHPDHVLGASVFVQAGAKVVGHAGLERALADRRENYLQSLQALIGPDQFIGTQTVRTDIAISDRGVFDLGGRRIALRAWPVAHTGTDLTAQDLASGLLFTGDLVFDEHTPALDGSVLGWEAVLNELAAEPIAQVMPGHGGPLLDWPEGAAPMLRYLGVLAADTRTAIASGLRLGDAVQVIAQSEAPHWDLFGAYNARNATVAFTELEWE
ncbi:quinoprotein relay system zinc metallohydrolase 2 [Puniceibacterium sediminis]|uniref:Quinoprotein relay system zinc metallohydrolase 2 n=1 Tax=Puniceibacterium sediminis TaxID=1608407 RepID=A0A238Y863_9RHOB|nr:quinoprotein relay system zinc metallohydrolase 2 [Puniceibacterium sediminis]SNR67287.1 quinoprotein relay system zinc metallohydrolase 2 [Puniceibacterium sediminis]